MYKRLPSLALVLTVAVLGTSACEKSGDKDAAASPAPATVSATPSASPEKVRTLTGASSGLYLMILRKNYSDLSHIDDDTLVAHGNALCVARGQALGDQAKKTMRELDITPKQATQIMATAHTFCR
ncbi:hypothetical protein ACFQ2B_22330 [Streptomyces stramineus]|uniref:DUF732 domain-containing protein n=1 Tax=Streptomyces stramineus TaxID=173861 RepID=A0ABN0ZU31_9ACTN